MITMHWNPLDRVTNPGELLRRRHVERRLLRHARNGFRGTLSMDIIHRFMRTNWYVPKPLPITNTTCRCYDQGLDMVVPGWDRFAVYIDRDWSCKGMLRVPYRVCIHEYGKGHRFYLVRTLRQLEAVLSHWERVQKDIETLFTKYSLE
jgi:hypothetical protein